MPDPSDILRFWLEEVDPRQWWKSDPDFDALITQRFSEPGLEPNLAAEVRYKAIIDRFGRYPHRNAVLGRQPTAEEEAFLRLPGSSF